MGELFETLFSLIPIALIIALRIAMSRKKKAEAEEKNKLIEFLKKQGLTAAPAAPAQAGRPMDDEEVGVAPRGHWEDEEDAWNEDYPGDSEGAPQLVSDFKSLSRPQELAPQPAFAPAPVVFPVPAASYGALSAGEGVRPEGDRVRQERASAPFTKRLGRLSELQRAVVLSEVLGRPKGLG